MKKILFAIFAAAALLSGCSHVMSEAKLATADRSINYADINRNPEALAGRVVLVGGVIAEHRSSGDIMQFEVSQLALLDNGVPDQFAVSGGRFLVISGELLDPALYRPGTFVTVIGEIRGQKIQKLAGADYRYPLLSAKEIHLFPTLDAIPEKSVNPYQPVAGDGRGTLRPAPALLEEQRPRQ